MLFFVANDGTIIKGLPSPVYQGAANTNTIYLIAPFATNTAVTVAFKLPNGVWTEPAAMTAQNALQGIVNEVTGQTYAGWTYDIPNNITEYYGTVTAQFFFYSAQAGVITATSATSFQVAKGVPAVLPDTPSEDIYEQILSNLSSLQTQLNNGSFAARSIYAWNSTYTYGANEITFYPDIGEFGAFVKSVQTGNTGNAPYVDGAVNSAWWTEVVNFNNITEDYLGELNDLIDKAEEARDAAQSSATAAAQSASNATGSATQARQYATAAEGHANAASGSAEQAASSATAAAGSATAAGQSASAAEQSATQAEQNASAAATSAGQAAQSASAAQASADRAQQIVDGIGDVYTPVGSIPYAQLPATPSQAERGYVYNITDSFTTDSRFVEGAGLQYAAGTNVAVVLNGSQYMYDVLGGMVDLSNYAQTNGSYPNMSVGKATSDGDGNNIAATYAKQSGTYPNLTAGSAQKVAPAGLINSGTEGWWKFLQVQYSGGSAGLEAVLNEVFLVNGLLDYFESSDTYTEAAALLQLQAVYLPQTNAWKEYSLVYLDGDMPYTRFCVYADAEGLHVSQYGTQSEMNLVPLSSKSSGFTVSYAGGPATPPEERKEPEVLLPMLNGAARVYTYNGSDFTAQAGDSYIIDEPNIVSGGNTLAVGDLVQDSSGAILRLTTVNDGSGLAIGTVLGRHIPYYLKPGTGIPKSHLAQAVQTSLGKADTALQSAPVTSVAGKTGAVTLAKGDVGLSNVDNVQQYSASNPPPYPVSSVNGQTGAVNLTTADAEVLSGLAFDEGFGQTSGNIVGYRIGKLVVVTVIFTPGSSGVAWRDMALATGLPLPRVEGSLNPNPEYVGVCIPETPCKLDADGITDVQFNLRMYGGSSRLWLHRCTTTNGAAVGAGVKFKGTIAYVCQ